MNQITLISEDTLAKATLIARRHNLRPRNWLYIPFDAERRERAIMGRRGYTESQLIGSFTPNEIKELTRL